MTASEKEWQQMTTSGTANENEWKWMRANKREWFWFQNEKKYAMCECNIFNNIDYLKIGKSITYIFNLIFCVSSCSSISLCFSLSVLLRFIKACYYQGWTSFEKYNVK